MSRPRQVQRPGPAKPPLGRKANQAQISDWVLTVLSDEHWHGTRYLYRIVSLLIPRDWAVYAYWSIWGKRDLERLCRRPPTDEKQVFDGKKRLLRLSLVSLVRQGYVVADAGKDFDRQYRLLTQKEKDRVAAQSTSRKRKKAAQAAQEDSQASQLEEPAPGAANLRLFI